MPDPQNSLDVLKQLASGPVGSTPTPSNSSLDVLKQVSSKQSMGSQGNAEPGFWKQAGSMGTDLAKGFGEGALDTVNSVSRGLNKIPGVGE